MTRCASLLVTLSIDFITTICQKLWNVSNSEVKQNSRSSVPLVALHVTARQPMYQSATVSTDPVMAFNEPSIRPVYVFLTRFNGE
jgi:hypothetical protein